MFTIKWDDHAWAQAQRFQNYKGDWDESMYMMSRDLAEYAQEFFTPYLHSVRSDPAGNGETARSVHPVITQSKNGFVIEYTGLISAYYMDIGNFPPSYVMTADSKNLKAFPVDRRFGNTRFAKQIHGMGYETPGVPNHWSAETVKHMGEDGAALKIGMEWMEKFLSEVVITV